MCFFLLQSSEFQCFPHSFNSSNTSIKEKTRDFVIYPAEGLEDAPFTPNSYVDIGGIEPLHQRKESAAILNSRII